VFVERRLRDIQLFGDLAAVVFARPFEVSRRQGGLDNFELSVGEFRSDLVADLSRGPVPLPVLALCDEFEFPASGEPVVQSVPLRQSPARPLLRRQ
jgi:hypothetical protein